MKAKHIKSVLRRKFKDFAESITDPRVKDAVEKDGLVTGGSIASMLLREDVNDYDIYFETLETTRLVAEYYVEKFKANPPTSFKGERSSLVDISVRVDDDPGQPGRPRVKVVVKSAGIASEEGARDYQYFEQADIEEGAAGDFVMDATQAKEAAEDKESKPKYRPVFLSTNAISLSDSIQVVTRFYGKADEIHENYDFIHCTCSWRAATGELGLPPAALEALLARELVYKTSRYPLCSIIRTRKFLKRNWSINAGQYLKMAWDLNKLDLTNPDVLEDQLVGVDAAYFQEVIDALRTEMKKTGATSIDGTYLMEIVDKVF